MHGSVNTAHDSKGVIKMGLYDFQDIDTGYIVDILRTHGAAYIGWSRGLGLERPSRRARSLKRSMSSASLW